MAVSNFIKPVRGKTKPIARSFKSPKEGAGETVCDPLLEPQPPVINPLASLAGKYDDEPLWDDYMAAIQQYRQEVNEQENTTE